jgi:DNA-binding MarR family transcriptional regulator
MTDITLEPRSGGMQNPSGSTSTAADDAQNRPGSRGTSHLSPGLETWRTFLQAHATVVRRLEADLEADGQISLADLEVLLQLANAQSHKLRMSELAETVLLSRSGMTRRIDRLEAAGLVQRHECAADRRGAYAGITADGLARLRNARPTHLRGIEEHFVSRLTADDMATIRDALNKLIPLDDRPTEKGC